MFIMIQLKNVLAHHVWLSCKCGHSNLIAVIDLVEEHGESITLDQVRRHARCTQCERKGNIQLRLVYVGGSQFALSGSNTKE